MLLKTNSLTSIRPFVAHDSPRVLELLDRLGLDYPSRELSDFYVLETGGAIAGMAEFKDLGRAFLLSCVGVDERCRGGGMGLEIVRFLAASAHKPVYLYTLIPEFFERAGFRAAAPPSEIPPRGYYQCEGCRPQACRCMAFYPGLPLYPRSIPLSPDHLPLLSRMLRSRTRKISDLALANTLLWRDCERTELALAGGSLCLLLSPSGEPPYFLEPIGGRSREAVDALCDAGGGGLSRVSEDVALELAGAGLAVQPMRDQFDYVYETGKLAEMSGRKLDGPRNRIRKFLAASPSHEFVRLTPDHAGEAEDLYRRWSIPQGGAGDAPDVPHSIYSSIFCQKKAMERAFEEFAPLGLLGGAVRVGGRMVGILLGSELNAETAVVHFLYTESGFAGLTQYLLRETCRHVFDRWPTLNLETDQGVPGLRDFKSSLNPLRLEQKFQVAATREM